MTAPRKPVAWIRPSQLKWLGANGRRPKDGVQVRLSAAATIDRKTALYLEAPDLQPLWALVEKWEALETDFAAYKFCARELRQKLEAMQ